jgi:DNA end-binding protein Ku
MVIYGFLWSLVRSSFSQPQLRPRRPIFIRSTLALAIGYDSKWSTNRRARWSTPSTRGRGYELSKGHYVPIDEDELKAVAIESTHTIDITGFVPTTDIDKRYLDKPYYITPQGKVGADAFAVIRDAMKDKDRVALAKIVIAHREHIIALEPLAKGLLGTTLRYDYEVRDEKAYLSDIPSPRVSKDMIDLAAHILATKETRFDPRKFKDEYETALKKLVRRKAKGHTIEEAPPPERPDNVINLMDALRQSLGKKHAGSTSKGRSARTTRTRKAA